jgi:hypothetical protein
MKSNFLSLIIQPTLCLGAFEQAPWTIFGKEGKDDLRSIFGQARDVFTSQSNIDRLENINKQLLSAFHISRSSTGSVVIVSEKVLIHTTNLRRVVSSEVSQLRFSNFSLHASALALSQSNHMTWVQIC